jgi:hypothetical protein
MDVDKIKKDLNLKNTNVEVLDISEEGPGKVSMDLKVGAKELAYLTSESKVNPITPLRMSSQASRYLNNATASVIRRDALMRSDLDAAEKSVLTSTPHELYTRSIAYYKTKDIYSSVIKNLTNFASNGFENDIDDPEIKLFFDNWGIDTGMDLLVEQIFFDLFRIGMVRTYKVVGKYEPMINIFPSNSVSDTKKQKKDSAAKKHKWSKTHIPIKYTILNPSSVVIKGSMLFGSTYTAIKADSLSELKEIMEDEKKGALTEHQKKILKSIPEGMKNAATKNEDFILDPYLVGEVDYRKQPYERYPLPRGIAAFDVIDYKDELKKADYSTLDGITNYILKITVGNDEYPVTDPQMLETVAELFNTPSKSYHIVYNHTLKIEKIVSPEIEAILGKDKYAQVNEDYTGALGFVRALIDGSGDISKPAADLAMKSVIAEVEYARRQVIRWLYGEYRDVAEAMGFDRYPTVRFNDIELRDIADFMRLYQGMIDRRVMSYETGIKRLGLGSSELDKIANEKDKVFDGTFGLFGSPNTQGGGFPQRTPNGTPSEGRPKESPNKNEKDKDKASVSSIVENIKDLSEEEFSRLVEAIKSKGD